MNDSGQHDTGSVPFKAREREHVQIFVCDASAEAGRLLTALQGKGYPTVDVPLGLLASRVRYELPILVICDSDAREAEKCLSEMREVAEQDVPILLIGQKAGTTTPSPDMSALASATIARPIDVESCVRKIEELVGPPNRDLHRGRAGRVARTPILVASARKPYRSDRLSLLAAPPGQQSSASEAPSAQDPHATLPPDSFRLSLEFPGTTRSSRPPPSSTRVSLSTETNSALEEGRRRAASYPVQSARPIRLSTTHQDLSSAIRDDFLQALTEPLDAGYSEREADKEPSEKTAHGTNASTDSRGLGEVGTSPPQPLTLKGTLPDELTNPGGKSSTRPPVAPTSDLAGRSRSTLPPIDDLSDLLVSSQFRPPSNFADAVVEPDSRSEQDDSTIPPILLPALTVAPPARRQGLPPPGARLGPREAAHPPRPLQPQRLTSPSVAIGSLMAEAAPTTRLDIPKQSPPIPLSCNWTPAPAIKGLALAIRERRSGALAQEERGGIRRIILTDGDISTVVSSITGESLADFLGARGDFSDEVLTSLGGVPSFGRHAGAALIARGLLGQEDLWPVLRAHAEWILSKSIASSVVTHWEPLAPPRVSDEPAVFGGAAGAEIYVDTIRRHLSTATALTLLGGESQVLSPGAHHLLLSECALSSEEEEGLRNVLGKPVKALINAELDLLTILYGLVELRVFSAGGEPRPLPSVSREVQNHQLDEEAFLSRLKSRRILVDQGDYFELLGISHSATSYEVSRARDELLNEYAAERLTVRSLHMSEDIRLVRETIHEAHLVLRDDTRRMRYRLAIEAVPE